MGNQPEMHECICGDSTFQNGRHTDLQDPLETRLLKVDLKEAYFSVPSDQYHKKYPCFKLEGKPTRFTCLLFGLTSAQWVFTKILRPIAALGQVLQFSLVIYIDDILLMAELKGMVQELDLALVFLLQCLRFTVNMGKTVYQLKQSSYWVSM